MAKTGKIKRDLYPAQIFGSGMPQNIIQRVTMLLKGFQLLADRLLSDGGLQAFARFKFKHRSIRSWNNSVIQPVPNPSAAVKVVWMIGSSGNTGKDQAYIAFKS